MKKIILFTILVICISCKAQVYPLTTDTDIPTNSYIKDINNELPAFEGTWKGTWKGKTFTINFKKIVNQYNDVLKIYNDRLIGKFQVKGSNGSILFDNLSIADNKAKIEGGKIFPSGAYSLSYLDPDLCDKMGFIIIKFTNATKTEMRFKYGEVSNLIDSSCFYHSFPDDQTPEPLPKEIILTKQ